MITYLEHLFGQWAKASQSLGGPNTPTVGIRIDSDHSNGTHWNLTEAQEQRLINLLLADVARLKAGS